MMTLGELRERLAEIARLNPSADLSPVYVDGAGYYDDWIEVDVVETTRGVVLVKLFYGEPTILDQAEGTP